MAWLGEQPTERSLAEDLDLHMSPMDISPSAISKTVGGERCGVPVIKSSTRADHNLSLTNWYLFQPIQVEVPSMWEVPPMMQIPIFLSYTALVYCKRRQTLDLNLSTQK